MTEAEFSQAKRDRGRALDYVLGALLLLTLLARQMYFGGAHEGPDLEPRPDALEYALAAESFVQHGEFRIDIAGVSYPSRYPPGFSAIVAPYVAIFGIEHAWLAATVNGILAVLLTALLGRLVAGTLGGFIAGMIVATSPASVQSSFLAMSETTSQLCLVIVLLAATLLRWRTARPRRGLFVLGAVFVGIANLVRYTNLAFALPLVLLALRRDDQGRRSAKLAAIAIAPAVLALVVLGARNASLFGNPLHDGYRFWVPELYASGRTFALAYLVKPLAGLFPTGNLAAYGAALGGLSGVLYAWPVAILALIGLVRALAICRRCPVAATLVAASVLTMPAIVGFYLVYAWQDTRFLEPLVPLVAALAASGVGLVTAGCARLLRSKDDARAPATIFVALFCVATFFAMRGSHAGISLHSETRPLLEDLANLRPQLEHADLVLVDFDPSLARRATTDGTPIVLSDLDTVAPYHYARVLDHDLHGRDGRRAEVRALARKGAIDEAEFAAVRDLVLAGKRVIFLAASNGVSSGPAIARLVTQFDFHPLNAMTTGGLLTSVHAVRIDQR